VLICFFRKEIRSTINVQIIGYNSEIQRYASTTASTLTKAAAYLEKSKKWNELISTYSLLIRHALFLDNFQQAISYGQSSEAFIKKYFTKATPEDTLMRARLYHSLTFMYLDLYQQYKKSDDYLQKSEYYLGLCQKHFTKNASIFAWIYPLNDYATALIEEFRGNYLKAIKYYAKFAPTIPKYRKFDFIRLYRHLHICHYGLKNYALANAYLLKNQALVDDVEIEMNRYIMDYGISSHALSKRDVEILLTNERAENARIEAENSAQLLWIILISLGSVIIYLIQQQVYKNKKDKLIVEATLANLQKENTTQILELQEQERQHIAQELHDSLGGMLAIAKLNAENTYAIPSEENMLNLIGLLNESQNELRQIIDHFQMPTFGKVQLTDMMSDWVSKLREWNPTINFQFQYSGQEIGSDLMRQQLFRVTQELIYNAIKHAQASIIHLELNFFEDNAILLIQDNGIGFDVTQPNKGRGLTNIHSRLGLLKGHINFFANEPTGTCVLIHIPLII
jgi:signal transduction histidine kinase